MESVLPATGSASFTERPKRCAEVVLIPRSRQELRVNTAIQCMMTMGDTERTSLYKGKGTPGDTLHTIHKDEHEMLDDTALCPLSPALHEWPIPNARNPRSTCIFQKWAPKHISVPVTPPGCVLAVGKESFGGVATSASGGGTKVWLWHQVPEDRPMTDPTFIQVLGQEHEWQ